MEFPGAPWNLPFGPAYLVEFWEKWTKFVIFDTRKKMVLTKVLLAVNFDCTVVGVTLSAKQHRLSCPVEGMQLASAEFTGQETLFFGSTGSSCAGS